MKYTIAAVFFNSHVRNFSLMNTTYSMNSGGENKIQLTIQTSWERNLESSSFLMAYFMSS